MQVNLAFTGDRLPDDDPIIVKQGHVGWVCCPQLFIAYIDPADAAQFEMDSLEMGSDAAAHDAFRQKVVYFWWWDDIWEIFNPVHGPPAPKPLTGITYNGEPLIPERYT